MLNLNYDNQTADVYESKIKVKIFNINNQEICVNIYIRNLQDMHET